MIAVQKKGKCAFKFSELNSKKGEVQACFLIAHEGEGKESPCKCAHLHLWLNQCEHNRLKGLWHIVSQVPLTVLFTVEVKAGKRLPDLELGWFQFSG